MSDIVCKVCDETVAHDESLAGVCFSCIDRMEQVHFPADSAGATGDGGSHV